ncbi:hypothetical protein DLAC_09596 [Tieghemostelium lacteum]|uniref:Uncharacterized protein n=1 Tax=Tieghemostelium lacteum TaxID=361077 RepID=A0A151Z6N9_TIELA|nr:hypothetical protein DLAC_09596 [Tieghemostelium lacteum]|eukprot:KYQ89631.1 hypothetical protein DLAC_09596 [Tieghemostelium lacteum]
MDTEIEEHQEQQEQQTEQHQEPQSEYHEADREIEGSPIHQVTVSIDHIQRGNSEEVHEHDEHEHHHHHHQYIQANAIEMVNGDDHQQQHYESKSDDVEEMDEEDEDEQMSPQSEHHHHHQHQLIGHDSHRNHRIQQQNQRILQQQSQQSQQQQQDVHMDHHQEDVEELDQNTMVQLGSHIHDQNIDLHHHHHHHHQPSHHHHPYSKKCCNCDCDCGQFMVNSMNEIISDKMGLLWDQYNKLFQQTQHIENLLNSVIHIKYPELKKKTMMQQPAQPQPTPHLHHPQHIHHHHNVQSSQQNIQQVLQAPQSPPQQQPQQQPQPPPQQQQQQQQSLSFDGDLDEDQPKKRRRNYSHDISNKINSILEPLFESGWVLLKEQERSLGEQIANEIGVELAEGMLIVRSFWHRSRGNSKRLFNQLDDYRIGLDLLEKEDPETKADLIKKFKFEDSDQVRRDLEEVNKVLKEMAAKGSGRTTLKGKKILKKLPDHSIKTFKGRSATLCNHFYHYYHNNLDLNTLELINPDFTPSQLANNLHYQQQQQQLQQQQLAQSPI